MISFLTNLGEQCFVVFILLYLADVINQLGRVSVALLIGWKPLTASLGSGRKWTIFRIRDFSFQLGALPLDGSTLAVATRIDHFKSKWLLFTVSRPAINLCVLPAALGIASGNIVSDWWLFPLRIFLLVQAIALLISLVPFHMQVAAGRVSSDGMTIWNVLMLSQKDIPTSFAGHALVLHTFLINEGRFAEAKEVVTEAFSLTIDPWNARILWIHFLLEAGQPDAAKAECERLLAGDGDFKKTHVEILDGLACIPIYYNHPEMLNDASHYINMALAEAPDLITLKGTKASILIEQGFVADGMKLLEEVIEKSDSKNDQAICKYYMALGWYKNGEVNKAYEYLRAAQAFDPKCMVHTQVENQLAGLKNARS